MEYQKFGNTLIVRLDRGEEIVDRLLELARREHITLASVNGLGAVDEVTVGVYFPATKEYKSNQFQGEYEIISLHGTLTTQQGQPYGHFHMSIGDQEGRVFGGHLNRAVISATCELVVTLLDGRVERKMDPEIGLNLMTFEA